MDIKLPILTSSDTKVANYCNFIEYTCLTNGEILYDEFDIGHSTSDLKSILDELTRRLVLYGDYKPYTILKDRIKSLLNKNENLHYAYCLYYSLKGGTSDSSITNIFEQITDISLKNYFSTDKSFITSIGMDRNILRNKIDDICSSINEDIGNKDHIPPQAKDGSIDIITYKPVDNRGNQLICLTDATIGKNWKDEKMVNAQLDKWKQFVHFKAIPQTCLSIVHVITTEEFHHVCISNGLMFDRTRIIKYFFNSEFVSDTYNQTIESLQSWVLKLS